MTAKPSSLPYATLRHSMHRDAALEGDPIAFTLRGLVAVSDFQLYILKQKLLPRQPFRHKDWLKSYNRLSYFRSRRSCAFDEFAQAVSSWLTRKPDVPVLITLPALHSNKYNVGRNVDVYSVDMNCKSIIIIYVYLYRRNSSERVQLRSPEKKIWWDVSHSNCGLSVRDLDLRLHCYPSSYDGSKGNHCANQSLITVKPEIEAICGAVFIVLRQYIKHEAATAHRFADRGDRKPDQQREQGQQKGREAPIHALISDLKLSHLASGMVPARGEAA